ncbi:hypothetical protein V1522DRAFT_189513 [Lipomyces starkeyi]
MVFSAPEARVRRSRRVICLDSVAKLRSEAEEYDLIVIYECQIPLSRRFHYRCLAGCNEDLREDTTGFGSCDMYATSHTRDDHSILYAMHGHGRGQCLDRWRKINAAVVLHPMKVLTSRSSGGRTLSAYLVSWYLRHFDRQTGRSTMPTVVFTTRALQAGLLLSLLRKSATEHFGADAASRIKGI